MKKHPDFLTGIGFVGLIFSSLCLLTSNLLSARKLFDISRLSEILRVSFQEYRDEILDIYGERKAELIRDAVVKNKFSGSTSNADIYDTGLGDTLCFDTFSGLYFHSDIEKIRRAANRLNNRLNEKGCVSLNEFYQEFHLPQTTIAVNIGWNADRGPIDIFYNSCITDDGTHVFTVNYSHNLQPL